MELNMLVNMYFCMHFLSKPRKQEKQIALCYCLKTDKPLLIQKKCQVLKQRIYPTLPSGTNAGLIRIAVLINTIKLANLQRTLQFRDHLISKILQVSLSLCILPALWKKKKVQFFHASFTKKKKVHFFQSNKVSLENKNDC